MTHNHITIPASIRVPNGLCGHSIKSKDHLIKFYDSIKGLTDSLCDYVVPGISRGDGIILICTNAHLYAFEKALEKRSIDVSRAKAAGQILILDAEQTLSTFMDDGLPDARKFKEVISGKIERMLIKFPNIRAYGEMVNILRNQKNMKATIKLEKLWNNLSNQYPFALMCSYHIETAVHELCSEHTHYITPDGELFKNLPQSSLT